MWRKAAAVIRHLAGNQGWSPLRRRFGLNTADTAVLSTPQEFAEGYIPSALNVEVTQLPQEVDELTQYLGKPVVTVRRSAVRSAYAALFLRGYGFPLLIYHILYCVF
ncbi:rhodanese-like domain-containing protein [Desulfoscipio sp. XC116]|uniref:rhodanese-like domain-containing protein n=1 Tax=Desulfoscipio sp. XC116 TaxID=3144975 RepID=UPI00325BDE8E